MQPARIAPLEHRSRSVARNDGFKQSAYFRRGGRFPNLNNFDSFINYSPDRYQSRNERAETYMRLMDDEPDDIILATDNR